MLDFHCIVLGEPVPKARARTVRLKPKKGQEHLPRRVISYTPENTMAYEANIRDHAFEKMEGDPIGENVALVLCADFYVTRPESVKPKKRPDPVKKPDIDNLIKSVMDALQGIVYVRDQQVVRVIGEKFYGQPARTVITVTEKA